MKKTSLLLFTALISFSTLGQTRDYLPPLSDGIGESGREVIAQNQSKYPLKIVLVGEAGVYLSDVDISICNAHGEVVSKIVTNGPILLVDLDPGTYTITANTKGIARTAKVTVGKTGLTTTHIRFPIMD